MFITHEHYENSMSGANSYVGVYENLEDAKNEMYDSIRYHISHCEETTMEKMIDRLKLFIAEDRMQSAEEDIDGFLCIFGDGYYFITDQYQEDEYHFTILDTDKGEMFNDF